MLDEWLMISLGVVEVVDLVRVLDKLMNQMTVFWGGVVFSVSTISCTAVHTVHS